MNEGASGGQVKFIVEQAGTANAVATNGCVAPRFAAGTGDTLAVELSCNGLRRKPVAELRKNAPDESGFIFVEGAFACHRHAVRSKFSFKKKTPPRRDDARHKPKKSFVLVYLFFPGGVFPLEFVIVPSTVPSVLSPLWFSALLFGRDPPGASLSPFPHPLSCLSVTATQSSTPSTHILSINTASLHISTA